MKSMGKTTKKPYRSPQVRDYGKIKEITKTGGTSNRDEGPGSRKS